MPVPGQGYLATFTFQPSEGATGAFSTAVKEVYSVSCLNDSADVLLASGPGEIELIGVGVGGPSDEHCERVACQTGTCVNYECDGNGVPDMCDLADAIPPASTWGLIILTLLLLTGAKVVRVLPCGAT